MQTSRVNNFEKRTLSKRHEVDAQGLLHIGRQRKVEKTKRGTSMKRNWLEV